MNRKLMACVGLLLLCLVCVAAWFVTKAPTYEIPQNPTIKSVEKLSDEELLSTYVKGWELAASQPGRLVFSQASQIPSYVLFDFFLYSLDAKTDEQRLKYKSMWYNEENKKFQIPIEYIENRLDMYFEGAVFVPSNLRGDNGFHNQGLGTIDIALIDGWGGEMHCTVADKKIKGNELVLTVNFGDIPLTKVYTIKFENGLYKYLSILDATNNVPDLAEKSKADATMTDTYLNEIALKIINRQIVPDTYFAFIENKSLIESIISYNKLTSTNRRNVSAAATCLLEGCYGLEIDDYRLANASADVRGIVEKIIHYSLYKNTLELMQGDADFAQTFYRADTQDDWNEKSVDNPWTRFLTGKQWSEKRLGQYNEYELGYYDADAYWAVVDSITEQLKKEGARIDNHVIIDQILRREVIQDTYLDFIGDPEIVKTIREYNKLTAKYIFHYTPGSIILMTTQSELQTMDVKYQFHYFDRLDEVKRFSAQIAKYALYGNCSDLIYAMPDLAFDGASGVGQWPRFFQDVPQAEFDAYLKLVDGLIAYLK